MSHGLKNWRFESNLSKITRPVAAIKSLRFALFVIIGIIIGILIYITYKEKILTEDSSLGLSYEVSPESIYPRMRRAMYNNLREALIVLVSVVIVTRASMG